MKVKKSTANARREFAKIPHLCPNCKETTTEKHLMVQSAEDILLGRERQYLCVRKD